MKFIIKDAHVLVNNVDLSNRVAQVAVDMAADDVDVSTMGTGVHEHLGGLRNDKFQITFLSDFDPGSVDATLLPLLADADTQPEFMVQVSAKGAVISAANPRYVSGKCILLNYSPISGTIGARSETQVEFPSNEAIYRETT